MAQKKRSYGRKHGKVPMKFGGSGIKTFSKVIGGEKLVLEKKKEIVPKELDLLYEGGDIAVRRYNVIDPIDNKKKAGAVFSIVQKLDGQRIGMIDIIKTDKEIRGGGAGGILMKSIMNRAERGHVDIMALHFKPDAGSQKVAHFLYRREGFVPFDLLSKFLRKKVINRFPQIKTSLRLQGGKKHLVPYYIKFY